ncbi:MAG TPA: bifunctional phosphoribosyl-AMP cyclohydrolase/phosphoribosyl-ATP diphosphatase HisIE [Thermomicrobiaceae bacterium]|nr:bifunctional phosphoribosyl-AMP cyclohydrolase/phosphoribosyl-ATP diphosphatase HisIE [Thermomicrobiaceae bacterium]
MSDAPPDTDTGTDGGPVHFDERGLVPAIVQDATTGRVRMLGYMNRDALERTTTTRRLHFWSRSRQRLWMKGETSGNVHDVVEVRADCDGDTLLVRVHPRGPTCHLGTDSCFDGTPILAGAVRERATSVVVDQVAAVVSDRHAQPQAGSYTSYLLEQGVDKIGKKIGEEAAEVIIAAKNADADSLANEASDLIYHLLVLLEASDVEPGRVWEVLSTRRGRPRPDQSS